MRALLAGRRNASLGVVLGLLGLLCLLAAMLGTTLYVFDSLHDLRATTYHRCLLRQQYDAASTRLREVEASNWHALATSESSNPYVSDEIRRARVAAYTEMAVAADQAVAAQVGGSCEKYRP